VEAKRRSPSGDSARYGCLSRRRPGRFKFRGSPTRSEESRTARGRRITTAPGKGELERARGIKDDEGTGQGMGQPSRGRPLAGDGAGSSAAGVAVLRTGAGPKGPSKTLASFRL